jgi:hypothetical protein
LCGAQQCWILKLQKHLRQIVDTIFPASAIVTPPTIISVLAIKENFEKPALKKIVKRSYNRRKLMNSIIVFNTFDPKSKTGSGWRLMRHAKTL